MVASRENEPGGASNRTTSERKSDREMVITRIFDAPPRLVFEAWTTPELFRQWWVPKSSGATLLSCEQDVRVGGGYRLEFAHPRAAAPMAFFGRYLEVVPNARLVWTNEESEDGAVTTVTFEEKDGKTLLVMRELYPSKEALDIAIEGMDEAMPETFEQLDQFLIARGAGAMLNHSDVSTRIPAQDLARARAFYSTRLGLEPVEERPGGLRYKCGSGYFTLFQSSGSASGAHTQMGWEVDDIEATVSELRQRGVTFEEYDLPGLKTVNGIAEIEGNYPSKGASGERGAWFRDSEGNLLGIGQPRR